MMKRNLQRLMTLTLAVCVFTAISVAPVAAADGVDLGGEDGVSIGTDGVSVGGDEGIDINTSSDSGVEVGAGGEEGVEVDADTEDGVEAGAGGEEGVEVGADTEDGVEVDAAGEDAVDAGTDGVSVAGQDVGGEGVENLPVQDTEGLDGLDGVGEDPNEVTSGIEDITGSDQGIENLPDDFGTLPGADGALPSENLPNASEEAPQSPIGGEEAPINACDTLDIESDTLPTDSLPGLDDLPSEAAPPGVPTNLLSTEAVLGLVLGYVPAPCEVYHPNDPPYDPVTGDDEVDPAYDYELQRLGEYNGGFVGVLNYDATMNESGTGPGTTTQSAIGANPEFGDISLDYRLQDGEKEYGVDPRLRYDDERVWGNAKLVFLGKNIGVEGECERTEQVGGDLGNLQEDPLGPCEYGLIGISDFGLGPASVLEILLGAGDGVGEEPVLPGEDLPINPDELLSV